MKITDLKTDKFARDITAVANVIYNETLNLEVGEETEIGVSEVYNTTQLVNSITKNDLNDGVYVYSLVNTPVIVIGRNKESS